MNIESIIQAWKDKANPQGLSEADAAALPDSPAGLLELTDDDLALVAGGKKQRNKRKKRRSRSRSRSRS